MVQLLKATTMGLQELHEAVLEDRAPRYDPRLVPAMDESQYVAYESNVGHTYYLYLLKLVKRLKPKAILEIGTSIGRSALFMMVGLPERSRLTTVDIGSHRRVDLAGFSGDQRLKIVYGDSCFPETVSQVGDGYDFMFLDSEHTGEQITAEWNIYKGMLTDGALVVLDDIHLNQGMEAFWDSLPFEKIDTGRDLHFSGFGLFRYRV